MPFLGIFLFQDAYLMRAALPAPSPPPCVPALSKHKHIDPRMKAKKAKKAKKMMKRMRRMGMLLRRIEVVNHQQ